MRLGYAFGIILVLVFAAILWITLRAKPHEEQSTVINPFSRCAAVAAFLSNHHPREDKRANYASEFKIYVKYSALFFSDADALTADIKKETDIIYRSLNLNPNDAGFLAAVADECTSQWMLASHNMLACIGQEPPTEKKRMHCAKLAVGLK